MLIGLSNGSISLFKLRPLPGEEKEERGDAKNEDERPSKLKADLLVSAESPLNWNFDNSWSLSLFGRPIRNGGGEDGRSNFGGIQGRIGAIFLMEALHGYFLTTCSEDGGLAILQLDPDDFR